MRRKVFLVTGAAGSYEDAHSWSVGVFTTAALAHGWRDGAAAYVDAWLERRRVFLGKHEDEDDVYDRMPKARSPFDQYLGDYDTDTSYSVEVVRLNPSPPRKSKAAPPPSEKPISQPQTGGK